jgi:thioredoxin reductase (NADPH)
VGAGISYCAVCDGAFYEDRDVVIVGGGNSALQEALFLSKICKSVTLVHRRGQFRADECLVRRFHAAENVRFLYPYTVSALVAEEDEVRGVQLRHAETGAEETVMTDGVFVAIGHEPETEAFASLGFCGEGGYFAVDESTETKINGVFVAGDCRAKAVRQLTTACGDGAAAAMAACRYLESL